MPSTPSKPLFAAALWTIGAVGVVCALATIYVLSYAPYVAWMPGHFGYIRDSHGAGYRPVEWLIDHTSLHDPLIRWAGVWGVEQQLGMESDYRAHPPDVQDLGQWRPTPGWNPLRGTIDQPSKAGVLDGPSDSLLDVSLIDRLA